LSINKADEDLTFAHTLKKSKLNFTKIKMAFCCFAPVDDTCIMLHQILVIPVKIKREYGKGLFKCVYKIADSTIRFVLSVDTSVCMVQLCSHWMDFHEIGYWSIF